jgi:hypothetical protein
MDAAVSAAAALLLEQECAGDACDVAHASIVVGVLQDALISGQAVDVQVAQGPGAMACAASAG